MTLILELSDNKEAALKARALSQGISVEQLVQRIVDRILEQPETVAAPPAKRRISQRIAEIPRDGGRQVDHYIYGLPKRD
jgi:plasmid stability protein